MDDPRLDDKKKMVLEIVIDERFLENWELITKWTSLSDDKVLTLMISLGCWYFKGRERGHVVVIKNGRFRYALEPSADLARPRKRASYFTLTLTGQSREGWTWLSQKTGLSDDRELLYTLLNLTLHLMWILREEASLVLQDNLGNVLNRFKPRRAPNDPFHKRIEKGLFEILRPQPPHS